MPQRPGLVTQCECLAFVHDNWIVCSENLALLQRENRGKSRLQTHLGLQAGYPRGGPTYLPAKKDAWKYDPTAPQLKLHSICNQLARFRCFFGLSLPKETVQNSLSVSTVTFSKPRMEKVSSHQRILSIGSFMSSGFSWLVSCRGKDSDRACMVHAMLIALKLRNVSNKKAPPRFRRALASWVVPSWAAVLKTNTCVACWAGKALTQMRKSNLNQWPPNVCSTFKPRISFHHFWLLNSKPPGCPLLLEKRLSEYEPNSDWTCWIRAVTSKRK